MATILSILFFFTLGDLTKWMFSWEGSGAYVKTEGGNRKWWWSGGKRKNAWMSHTSVNKKWSTNKNLHVTITTNLWTYLGLPRIWHNSPYMAKTYQCKYCAHLFPSMQGQCSHLAQAKKCHMRWWVDLNIMRIPSQHRDLSKIHDNNQSVASEGGCQAIVNDLNVDWDINKQLVQG